MRQLPDRPGISPATVLIKNGARRAARRLRSPNVVNGLSWLAWLLSVGMFAAWMLAFYHVAARPPWLGMTIRTSVFATWALVLREWIALRLRPPETLIR
jgi:hypothetical protein